MGECSSLCLSKSVGGMGFRDIQKFNNALLAKQVWRLIHQKDILLYKVFSVKYFPHRSIMEAPVPQKCSYAWWSIQLLGRMTILRYHTVQTMVEKRAKSTFVSITCSTISLKLMKCVDDRKPHTEICDHSGVSIGQDHRACTTSLASA